MALLALGELARRSFEYNCATRSAGLGAEVDDVVGTLDYLHIMLHDYHRMTCCYQGVEGLQQTIDVMDVQSRGWLVEDKHHSLIGKLACQVRCELNSLTLTAR